VGPIPVGVNKFVFEADPPNTTRIPGSDVLGVTVILLTCSYDEREFVRVGYYVNNEYTEPQLNEDPPTKPQFDKIRRSILADKPRVTRFQIKWDSEESAPSEYPPEQPEVDAQEDDGEAYGAEELEEEQAEIAAAEAEEAELAKAKVEGGEDAQMEGVEAEASKEEEGEDDEESDAGSEDLEAESEDDDEEELEEELQEGEAAAEGDHDMEVDDAGAQGQAQSAHPPAHGAGGAEDKHAQQSDVMVH
jgi:histone chaperone ASF1